MFGISPPDGVKCAWGARAIFRDNTIDLLWDRQTTVGEAKQCEKLLKWVNKTALPKLRKMARGVGQDEYRNLTIENEKYILHANPRSSYGYLYIGAWEKPQAAEKQEVVG